MVYNIEKMLKEQGDKISGSERGDVENALADAKKALESNDKAQMDRARETLTTASHKLAEQMYKAAQPQGGAQPGRRPDASAGPDPGCERLRPEERRRRDRRRVRGRRRQEVRSLTAGRKGRPEWRPSLQLGEQGESNWTSR